jgi:hypothetical protein
MQDLPSYSEFMNESFRSRYEDWIKVFSDNGYEDLGEDTSTGGEYWTKRFDSGVSIIEIHDDTAKVMSFSAYFTPYVKVDKAVFGLIKTRLMPKQTNISSGTFDFGEGLFGVEDTKVLNNFNRLLKSIDKRIKKIDVKWLPMANSQKIFKKEFWNQSRGGSIPSKILYKDPKDYSEKPI